MQALWMRGRYSGRELALKARAAADDTPCNMVDLSDWQGTKHHAEEGGEVNHTHTQKKNTNRL